MLKTQRPLQAVQEIEDEVMQGLRPERLVVGDRYLGQGTEADQRGGQGERGQGAGQRRLATQQPTTAEARKPEAMEPSASRAASAPSHQRADQGEAKGSVTMAANDSPMSQYCWE